ncbi:MAG TPA: hypothetical protein P5060_00050 [Candidatus Absconditabacterales bacterium]|nr:hypothetical protein [Candidatus Absconditabacterales bacterium]
MRTQQQAYDFIKSYMGKFQTYFKDWYVGIASNPEERLFQQHNVDRQNGNWCCTEALFTTDDARAVEKYFIDQHGTKGGTGGGDHTTKFVYAYFITSNTVE